MISLIWNKIKAWAAVAAALAIAISYAIVWRKGKKHAEDRQAVDRARAIEKRKEVNDEVNSLGSRDLDERARRWLRKP